MNVNRRTFLKTAVSLGVLSPLGALAPQLALGADSSRQTLLAQLVYPGGDWQPRPNALRRLAWELHKRTAVDAGLEPDEIKPTLRAVSDHPFLYISGDRPFSQPDEETVSTLSRFFKVGGFILVDPALTADGDLAGFEKSIDDLLGRALPDSNAREIRSGHVLTRCFYNIDRFVGRIEGPEVLHGYQIEDRLAVVRTHHDLGGAWARDNLGNWEHDVVPGGERQRESAFRLGINIAMYALCLDYKNESPHRRFGKQILESSK